MNSKMSTLFIIIISLSSCVSTTQNVANKNSAKRYISSTGKPFDEELYKALLSQMQNDETQISSEEENTEDSEIDQIESKTDEQIDISTDTAPEEEPIYNYEVENGFIQNIAATTLSPELLAASKKLTANTGTWAFKFSYIDKEGNKKVITEYNSHQALKPASTQKLFTGYLFVKTDAKNKNYSLNNLAAMLHLSHNEMADSALRNVAVKNNFEDNQMLRGIELIKKEFLKSEDGLKYNPADGSGLSYQNRVTVSLETHLLKKIYTQGRANDFEKYNSFKKMLAHPSNQKCIYDTYKFQKGHKHPYHSTMGTRLNQLVGRVYVKTGTLDHTKALAGFIDAKDKNGVIVFSIIGDYLKTKPKAAFAKINSIVAAHTSYVDKYLK